MNQWRRILIYLATGLTLLGLSIQRGQPDGRLHFWALDVGQGDSLLFSTPHGQHILIDGGPDDRILSHLGRHIPFWDRTIDLVILSHNHADHLAGLLDVLKRYEVKQVWLSGAIHTTPEFAQWLQMIKDAQIPTSVVFAGSTITIDAIRFDVLFPLTDQTGVRPHNQHDATIVIMVSNGPMRYLLTGDLEQRQEEAILAHYCRGGSSCPALAAPVLKVPHHGSKTGLTDSFLTAVSPKAAIISVGKRNRYGHPHPSIVQKLHQLGTALYRTDLFGSVHVTNHGTEIIVEPDRPW